MKDFVIDGSLVGIRLDNALATNFGSSSLRSSRRIIGDHSVLVNGHPSNPGYRLRRGDIISFLESRPSALQVLPFLIAAQDDYRFFYKPARLHTVILNGRNNASLESLLPEISKEDQGLILLQRLDFATSGIVCAAKGKDAAEFYRQEEKACKCRKIYLCALEGNLKKPVTVQNELLTSGGKSVRVLETLADKAGWTQITPLWHGKIDNFEQEVTIARCELARGQRHQIRAHAAFIGHPLAGDNLYGGNGEAHLLEHVALSFPGHNISYQAENSILKKVLAAGEGLCI